MGIKADKMQELMDRLRKGIFTTNNIETVVSSNSEVPLQSAIRPVLTRKRIRLKKK